MAIICERQCLAVFQRSMDSINLLQGFCQLNDVARQEDLQTLQRTLDSWYYGFGSPAVPGILESVEDDTGGATHDTSMHWLICEQIPDLIRISLTGPSGDIRAFARDLLLDLKAKKGFRIPQVNFRSPSALISLQQMQYLDCLKEEPLEDEHLFTVYTLFREHWFQWCRLDNYICVMGFHPEYLESFIKVQYHLFRGDLPIPYPDRHYLALLAAAEQRCIYLVLLFARQFISDGGDVSWLQGLQHAPLKWRQLAELNNTLCNTPWKITADQIYDLTHGGNAHSSRETLSLSELMLAIAIMTHVHALASFIFGCAITPEMDQLDCTQSVVADPSAAAIQSSNGVSNPSGDGSGTNVASSGPCANCQSSSSSSDSNPITNLVESAPLFTTQDSSAPATQLLQRIQEEYREWEELDEEAVVEQFVKVVQSNQELDTTRSPMLVAQATELRNKLDRHVAIARFVHSTESVYENFDGQPYHVSEFGWQDEGYALTDRLCTDLGTMLDEKFRNAYDLTYNTLSSLTGVDTSLYRHSVWNFVQSLFGLCNEDSRYDCINRLLRVEEQVFLKCCATKPDASNPTNSRLETIFPVLSPSEVVHVIIMTMEARQQACLLYALRAISECQARVHR